MFSFIPNPDSCLILAHTADNTFLGFAVEHKEIKINSKERNEKNIALLYGKNPNYFKVFHKMMQ